MRKDSGTFLELQSISIPNSGNGLGLAIADSITELVAGAPFEGSAYDEMQTILFEAVDGRGFRPNGDHLAGRNVESELTASLEKLAAIRDDDGQDPALRAAMIPEIVKIEGQLIRREFMKPLRDENWGGDIGEFVSRIAPHNVITGRTPAGIAVVQSVGLKIETLRCSVDDNGEVCAWIYSEGEL